MWEECNKCEKIKPFYKFNIRKNSPLGLFPYCKKCKSLYDKEYYKKNSNKLKKQNNTRHYKSKYGMTIEEKRLLLSRQNNKCLICEREFKKGIIKCIDHDHKTNKVRGVLCHNCNFLLGHCKDNIKILEKAIKYLKDEKC